MNRSETIFASLICALFLALLFFVIADSYQEIQCLAKAPQTPAPSSKILQLCKVR